LGNHAEICAAAPKLVRHGPRPYRLASTDDSVASIKRASGGFGQVDGRGQRQFVGALQMVAASPLPQARVSVPFSARRALIGSVIQIVDDEQGAFALHNRDDRSCRPEGQRLRRNLLGCVLFAAAAHGLAILSNNNAIFNRADSDWNGDVVANGGGSNKRGARTGDVQGNAGTIYNEDAEEPAMASALSTGAMLRVGRTSAQVEDRDTSGDNTDYGAGLYGGRQWAPPALRLAPPISGMTGTPAGASALPACPTACRLTIRPGCRVVGPFPAAIGSVEAPCARARRASVLHASVMSAISSM
jgi:hypothetical protein